METVTNKPISIERIEELEQKLDNILRKIRKLLSYANSQKIKTLEVVEVN